MTQSAGTPGEPRSYISDKLAAFVCAYDGRNTPAEIDRRAKLLMLDAIGIAFASTRFDFARCALAALRELGAGESDVIGVSDKLPLRDAILMNAVLVHGLDYDDTYLPGSVHLTAACVPVALGVGARGAVSGRELLAALVLGLEIDARLGIAGAGGFLRAGFHATSVLGTFASTLVAGRLLRLSPEALRVAQGIALSMASGNMQPMQDGTWTKRMHPGWAGVAGVTAATLAKHGFTGPAAAYEGRFGLFPHFLGPHFAAANLDAITAKLGEHWEFPRASIKRFPACHQSHAFMNATLELVREHDLDLAQIESIVALVAEPAVPLICEPAESKRVPDSSYAAQFSLPYAIACCLLRRRFGLEELEETAYTDPALRSLAAKVSYRIDPDAGFPRFRTGEVIVRMRDGRQLSRRKSVRPDEPAAEDEIVDKFMTNTASLVSEPRRQRIRDMVLDLEHVADAAMLTRLLSADEAAPPRSPSR